MIALSFILVVLAVLALGATAWFLLQQRHSFHLRAQFGPEYDRTVCAIGDRRRAEQELVARQQRAERLQLQTLSGADQDRYIKAWRATQAHFVDDPPAAVVAADRFIAAVMARRGYPVSDFEARAADLSVKYPRVVRDYRAAHAITELSSHGPLSTEDLRQALLHYRYPFEELLQTPQEVGQ